MNITVSKTNFYDDIKTHPLYESELAREEATLDISRLRFERNNSNLCEHHRGSDSPIGKVVIQRLCVPLAEAIREFIDPEEKSRGWNAGNKGALRSVLKELGLTCEEYTLCTLKAVLDEFFRPESGSLLSTYASKVTDAILVSAEYKQFRQLHRKDAEGLTERVILKKGTMHNAHGRATLRTARKLHGLSADITLPYGMKTQLGAKMVELLIESTGAFSLEKITRSRNDTPYILRASEELLALVKQCSSRLAELSPQFQIMLIPPKPWTGVYGGGYWLPLKSLHPAMVKCCRREINELKHHTMPNVLEALNLVQNTRWRINPSIYRTAQAIWDMGGNRGGICEREEQALPPRPWGADRIPQAEFDLWKQEHPEEYRAWSNKAQAVYKTNKHCGADRLRVAYQLKIARDNLQYDALYFPWTCDFRGRLYALPPYVNPQADDLGKALLTFADAKPLGAAGAYWLKIHLANCAGVDKVSFDDRLLWVQEHSEQILGSARDPLANRFWEGMDSPFQFLAAAVEYLGYHEYGESYACALPVAMDGTCNGLQHLSAMLRDPVGGAAVNLVPAMKPSDIYSEVLSVMRKLVQEDITSHPEASIRCIAQEWLPLLSRSLAKRPVMTTPYGVSRFGIHEQIMDQIRSQDWFQGFAMSRCEFAKYLTNITIRAIRLTIVAAPVAMEWMQQAAQLISESDTDASGISWIVPGSGFKAIQRYYADKRVIVNVFIGSQRLQMRVDEPDETAISSRRQVSGISPNVIHSLDASMLIQTVRTLGRQGIQHFALIHDSYGCHACDIPVLHQVLRQEFVNIYQNHDILKELKDAWETAYNVHLPPLPESGTLDVRMVNHSRYFFA